MTRPTSRRVAPLRPPSPRRLRRHGRRWPWLFALVPVAAAGWWWQRDDGGDPVEAAPTPTVPGAVAFGAPTGERSTDARCFMIAIDESSSMATADQAGVRADAVRATSEFLAAYGVDGDRIGTTWFAETAATTDPGRAGAVVLGSAPTTLGAGTRIAEGLLSAQAGLDRSCAGAHQVIVLVSDGEASGPGEFTAAREAITTAAEVTTHLIAMNDNGAFDSSRTFWEDPALGVASIQTITTFDRDEVSRAVAAILSIETGQQVAAA